MSSTPGRAARNAEVVDLYLDSLDQGEVDDIGGEPSNEKKISDGEVFRHIRCADLIGNLAAKKRWLSKLSASIKRDVLSLEKRADREPQTQLLLTALDRLLPFPGLWPKFPVGTLHRILLLRCPEEMARYLNRVEVAWDKITGGDKRLQKISDAKTVSILEGRCPRHSTEDRLMIRQRMNGLFPGVGYAVKEAAIGRACEIEYLIPSIFTFVEDSKLLEPCVQIMKRMLPSPCKTSIQQEFSRLHNGQASWYYQTSETSAQSLEDGSSDAARTNGYRQLWLFAMRHFPEMIGRTLRKDLGRPKPQVPGLELIWWYNFTYMAVESGFTGVNQIYSNYGQIDSKMTEAFLPHARPPQFYSCDMQKCISLIVVELSKDNTQATADTEMQDSEDLQGVSCGSHIASRCGVPFDAAFRADQKLLFLKYIDRSRQQDRQDRIGSFDVKRDVFHSFFGASEGTINPDAPNLTQPPSASVQQAALEPPSAPASQTVSAPVHQSVREPPSAPVPLPEPQPVPESHHHSNGMDSHQHSNEMDIFNSTRPPEPFVAEMDFEESDPTAVSPLTEPEHNDAVGESTVQRISLDAAIRMFRDREKKPNGDETLILKEESENVFQVHRLRRNNFDEIIRIASIPGPGSAKNRINRLDGVNYLAPNANSAKRLRTGLVGERRLQAVNYMKVKEEPLLLITLPGPDGELRKAFEQEEDDIL